MRSSRVRLACLLPALLLSTMACQADGADGDGGATPLPLPSRSGPPAGMDESLRDAALELVAAREQALEDGDREAFLATIDPAAEDFARSQARWWDNLARLPATDLGLTLGDEGVMTRVHGDGDLQLPIDFTMRLDGYDDHAVTQPLVYTFVGDEDEVLLTSDRNLQNDALTGWIPAPWDVTAIEVTESDGVLAVFDEKTSDEATELQADIVAARDDIAPLLPPWSGQVVAYDISDVDAIDRMSAMEIDDTAGVAFPVQRRPGSEKVAAYRFAVNPRHTDAGVERRLLFRHELVHVAMATDDDASPRWLVEGAAEFVARAAEWDVTIRRRIAAEQLTGVSPAPLAIGRDFYQVDPDVNYAVANLVCDYLASTRGEGVLWDLMRAFRREEAVFAGDVEDVVRAELGLSTSELSAEALVWARSA